jgi:hypothetical protein
MASEEATQEIESFLRTLTDVVSEFGEDYVYDNGYNGMFCSYVKDEAPSCIVAQILSRRGVSVEILNDLDSNCGRISNLIDLDSELRHQVNIVHNETIDVLSFAQTGQDCQRSWGEVLYWTKLYARVKYQSTIY